MQQRTACYANGCSCYGTYVEREKDCVGHTEEEARAAYSCTRMDETLVLPREALVTMSVYDFDTDQSEDVIEQLTVPEYSYFKTPLRPASGEEVESTVFVNEALRQFTGTKPGNPDDNPTDPQSLTPEQASRAVQFFFHPQDGSVDVTFTVSYSGTGTCTGRNLLFAGDSALCAPPPPQPPQLPPSAPPPSSPAG